MNNKFDKMLEKTKTFYDIEFSFCKDDIDLGNKKLYPIIFGSEDFNDGKENDLIIKSFHYLINSIVAPQLKIKKYDFYEKAFYFKTKLPKKICDLYLEDGNKILMFVSIEKMPDILSTFSSGIILMRHEFDCHNLGKDWKKSIPEMRNDLPLDAFESFFESHKNAPSKFILEEWGWKDFQIEKFATYFMKNSEFKFHNFSKWDYMIYPWKDKGEDGKAVERNSETSVCLATNKFDERILIRKVSSIKF